MMSVTQDSLLTKMELLAEDERMEGFGLQATAGGVVWRTKGGYVWAVMPLAGLSRRRVSLAVDWQRQGFVRPGLALPVSKGVNGRNRVIPEK
jgi:hypothetical protein